MDYEGYLELNMWRIKGKESVEKKAHLREWNQNFEQLTLNNAGFRTTDNNPHSWKIYA